MRFVSCLVLALLLVAPASAATRRPSTPAPAVVPVLEAGARPIPIGFVRMAAAGEPLRWGGSASQACDPDFAQALRAEFAAAGLALAAAPNAADLQLGARITDFQVRLGTRGVAVMDVEWQVYSTAAGKVVGKVATRGAVPVARGARLGETVAGLLQQAFAENVRQLEADPVFRQIAVTAAPRQAMQVGFRFGARPMALKEAVGGVVVIFAGEEMGSGVLISADGYILTNQHVAKGASHVRIRWADGGEAEGEVVRADARRDVALIKVAAAKGRPLAIRRTAVDLGETVYAIGTPMSDAYQNTVTRGIVSATRQLDGQSFIQSDAGMTHGNSGGPLVDEKGAVVGLADLTVDASNGATINFFIPIDEALKALALKPAG
jgi:S1-C subfamily serine protease